MIADLTRRQAIAQLRAFTAALESGAKDCVALSVVEAESGETTLSVQVATLAPGPVSEPQVAPPEPSGGLLCDCGRAPEVHSDGWDCMCGRSSSDSAGPS